MKEYWYLRDGDFLPEKIETLCENWKRTRREIVEFLSRQGNIFESREEAMEVSMNIRGVVIAHQVRQGRLEGIRIDIDNP